MTNPVPPEFSWLTPYITVRDVDKSAEFYQKAFRFTLKNLVPDEKGRGKHAELYYQDTFIMCGREGAYGPEPKTPRASGVQCPITLYMYTEKVDDFYLAAMTQGAKSVQKPEDMFWGDRMCRLADPDNYVWCFATYLGKSHL
jgi:uncharacterized glyoxalase superfamily protein PhnB